MGGSRSVYFLISERLVFRAWTDEDMPLAVSLWGDPEVTRLIDARGRLGDDEVRERLDREMAWGREHGVQYWPMFLRPDVPERFVGCCGLRPRGGEAGHCELGMQLRVRYWGQGYATEAGRAVIAHAFDTLGVESLFAGHHPDNAASRRVLEKLGFRYSHDELFEPTGCMHPSYMLMREEWSAASRRT